jgi:hypothetical protein
MPRFTLPTFHSNVKVVAYAMSDKESFTGEAGL